MHTLLKTAAVFALAVLFFLSFAEAAEKEELKKTFEGKDRIKIETVGGDCIVEPSGSDRITVTVINKYEPPESFESRMKERGSTLYLSEEMLQSNSGYSTWILEVPDNIEIDFSTASGDLSITEVGGRFSASTASGHIEVERSSGEYVFSSASGDVRLENCRGEFDVSTASGNIRTSDCTGIFDLSSASGDIIGRGVNLDDDSEFAAASGDVDIRLSSAPEFDLHLGTASGSALLSLNGIEPKGRFEFVAKVRGGEIDCPFSFDDEERFERGGDEYVRKSFTRGGDVPLITIKTASGEAELRK